MSTTSSDVQDNDGVVSCVCMKALEGDLFEHSLQMRSSNAGQTKSAAALHVM